LPLENPVQPAQPSPPAVQAAAANTASPQPAPLAQTTPEDVAPIDAAPSPRLAELLDTMVRDLTTAKQEIEHLKAGQEQIARDDAKVAEQLKATQQQMARVIANQNLRSKISAPPPGPTSASTRKPVPTFPAPQSTAQPQASRP
jgi:septal ring factor EnvC (AmiA/AmiB activator)